MPFSEVPEGVITEGEFVYEVLRKQTKKEHKVTGACIDEERRLASKLMLKGPQGFKKFPKNKRCNYRV